MKKSANDIIGAFKEYDKDNNGTLSVQEVYNVMKKFRGNISLSEVKELVKKVDKDGNGTINIAGNYALTLFLIQYLINFQFV